MFAWATLSARLERLDVTAPITFVAAGLLLTHGPLAVLGLHAAARTGAGTGGEPPWCSCCSRTRRASGCATCGRTWERAFACSLVGLPLTIGLGTLLAIPLVGKAGIWLALLVGSGAGADGRRAGRRDDGQPRGSGSASGG